MNEGFPKESEADTEHTAEYDGKVYDVYKLIDHASTLETETMSVYELLLSIGKNNYWKDKNGNWIGPHTFFDPKSTYGLDWGKIIVDHPELEEEIGKIKNANYLAHPILVDSKGYIIDGVHRLTKAYIEGADEIQVKVLKNLPEDAVISE